MRPGKELATWAARAGLKPSLWQTALRQISFPSPHISAETMCSLEVALRSMAARPMLPRPDQGDPIQAMAEARPRFMAEALVRRVKPGSKAQMPVQNIHLERGPIRLLPEPDSLSTTGQRETPAWTLPRRSKRGRAIHRLPRFLLAAGRDPLHPARHDLRN